MLRGLIGQGLLICLALSGISGMSQAEDAVAPGAIEYNRDVRPILAENCFRCHGPDSASRKADLRLDRREAAVESGAACARRQLRCSEAASRSARRTKLTVSPGRS